MNPVLRYFAIWARIFPWILRYPAKSLWHRIYIFFDYIYLYHFKGLNMDEYYEFEFDSQNKEFRNSFLGVLEQRYYLDLLNPRKYYTLARNKYLTHKVLQNTGVRKSELYCYYTPEGYVQDSVEIATSVVDVCRILKNKNVRKCVIKDPENSHGQGVIVVKDIEYIVNDCKLHLFNGEECLLSDILGQYPKIFEGLICQTAQLASFNSSSINTVRFMTTLYPNGEAQIIAAFIKIGRAGNIVDNAGDGGNVDACIDVESGMIKYAVQYDGWRKISNIEKHPDSGVQLNGVVIENWEQIKSDVIRFQQAMPWCKAAGWDVAITDAGATIIEVNDFWDRTGQLFIRKGWRYEIRDCYKAWKATGKSYGIPTLYRYVTKRSSWLND